MYSPKFFLHASRPGPTVGVGGRDWVPSTGRVTCYEQGTGCHSLEYLKNLVARSLPVVNVEAP